jgi:S-adenosylmethionine:tRNA ribosyltransferase-isomerase
MPGSLLVFNNTRVIKARLLFSKDSGACIEIFCLEPYEPSDYVLSFSASGKVEWKCLIGNQKKWKTGSVSMTFKKDDRPVRLKAEKINRTGDSWIIRFTWENDSLTFGEVIEAAGKVPLPPYINRDTDDNDETGYQTIFSRIKGSVAAPTAGLHFSREVLDKLERDGFSRTDLTLHVGAGTFQPVKAERITDHLMHTEHFFVSRENLVKLISNTGNIVAVGTTSLRSVESLYWAGVKLADDPSAIDSGLYVDQWEAYSMETKFEAPEIFEHMLGIMNKRNINTLEVSTRILIVPGYNFMVTGGLITNFHLPGSTLLLLIAAWTGEKWKDIYDYALNNDFRFLSYGDSSLLYR